MSGGFQLGGPASGPIALLAFAQHPASEYPFTIAELARLGIPYDISGAFRGRVAVRGVHVPVEHLVHLYRTESLTLTTIDRYTRYCS